MPRSNPASLVVRRGSWNHPANRIDLTVDQHPLNVQLTCVSPAHGPTSAALLLEPALSVDHYYSMTASPAVFLTQPLLDWIWSGTSVLAVTVDTRLHTGYVAALVPPAQLHLQVTAEQYTSLGINGRVVHAPYGTRSLHKHLIYTSLCQARGTTAYCTSTANPCTSTTTDDSGYVARASLMIPHRSQLCAALASLPAAQWRVTSEAPWLGADAIPPTLLRDVALLDSPPVHHHAITTPVPAWAALTALLTGASLPQQHAELAGVLEWLGSLVQAQPPAPLQAPLVSEEPCAVDVATARGLTRSSKVRDALPMQASVTRALQVWAVLQQARGAVASGALPWCAVAVQGPPHAPLSWTGTCSDAVHGVGLLGGGEHGYVVLLLPGDAWLLFGASGEGDQLQRLW